MPYPELEAFNLDRVRAHVLASDAGSVIFHWTETATEIAREKTAALLAIRGFYMEQIRDGAQSTEVALSCLNEVMVTLGSSKNKERLVFIMLTGG